jgi:ATP-dependent helicase HrpB
VTEFPVDEVIPALRQALAEDGSAVLTAPPGAGKTTRVPPALLDEPWLRGQRIVMLEPRRLAARAAARWMAAAVGEREGQTVGYRVRADTRVGPGTRIEVVTEGVLTRMIQSDPALEGIGLVIFDEFHERSLHADLGLSLCLECRDVLRPDLRLLVMSATLDAAAVAGLLGDARVISSTGRCHPVETRYLERSPAGRLPAQVADAVLAALHRDRGGVLAFLPGAAEIRATAALLNAGALPADVEVHTLFGALPAEAQDRAIRPPPAGRRKAVLATAIAETSLTIEGIGVVVDSGWMRVPRFSPRTGMTRLATVPVTRASADQRCGRAGRLGPGVCYRLWTEAEHAGRIPHSTPEILEVDLAPLALELAAWGAASAAGLRWLDAPPAAALAQADEVLGMLETVDADGRITAHGRELARLGLHPRLGHMVIRGAERGHGGTACDLAALLEDRDVLRGDGAIPDADVRLRLELVRAVRRRRRAPAPPGHDVDAAALRRVVAEADRWRRRIGAVGDDTEADSAGVLLALAYPERIGRRRPGRSPRFLLRGGSGAALEAGQSLGASEWIAAGELDGRRGDARIFLAAPLEPADLEALFGDRMETRFATEWDDAAGAVRSRRTVRLGALTVHESMVADASPEAVQQALLDGIRLRGPEALPWSDEARRLRERIGFARTVGEDLPDVSAGALMAELAEWLLPWLPTARRWEDVLRVDLETALRARLGWERSRALDEIAPPHYTAPSGSRVPIDYSDPAAPTIAVRLQEMFGEHETPAVAGGAVPLTVQMLSPARRPVQVTRDLASFWRSGYFDVRRELRGRYSKHYWPEDPLTATPTRRVRPG